MSEDYFLIGNCSLFNPDWYLQRYPDVAYSGLDPAEHYLLVGGLFQRDPGPDFDTQAYLKAHPEVAASRQNPLLHYLMNHSNTTIHTAESSPSWHSLTVNDIRHAQPADNDTFDWLAQTNDPYTILNVPTPLKGHTGYLCARLRLRTPSPTITARWYLDTGQGYNEQQVLTLPLRDQETREIILLAKAPLAGLRFDPQDEPGLFSIEELSLKVLPVEDAEQRMLAELTDWGAPSHARIHLQRAANQLGRAWHTQLTRAYQDALMARHSPSYAEWRAHAEADLPDRIAQVHARVQEHPYQPTFWIWMDEPPGSTGGTPNPHPLASQLYPHWQMLTAWPATADPHTYVLRLNAMDRLPTHALLWLADAAQHHPNARVIYADEDEQDAQGQRHRPHFKCDWNPDLHLSQDAIGHCCALRADDVLRIRNTPQLDQVPWGDWVFALRPPVSASDVVHLSDVLLHGEPEAPASDTDQRPAATLRRDWLMAQGNPAEVLPGLAQGQYRIKPALPAPPPPVSLLIPTRDRLNLLEPCVRSILTRTTYPHYEILILDNGSIEPATLQFFQTLCNTEPRVRVIRDDRPFNFSALNNRGVAEARGTMIGLVNNDIEVISPDWLDEMVRHACRPDIGCVGAKLYYEDDTIQHGGVIMGLGGLAGHAHKHADRATPGYRRRLWVTQNLSAVTAACLLVRKAVYEQVGGLNEEALTVAFNDVDFCLRVQAAGYRNLWTPYAELYHHESRSRGQEDTPAKPARFMAEVRFMQQQWPAQIAHDPCYSPHLSRTREDFSLRDILSRAPELRG